MDTNQIEFPLVTIVTVTYNCKELIASTIESVCQQIYPNKEHIIVDGASLDGTVEIIREYENCVTQFVSEQDGGIYDAMNKGICLASPDSHYITFMNAGDIYTNSHIIEKMVAGAKSRHTHLYGNVLSNSVIIKAPERLSSFVLSTNMVCHQTLFILTNIQRNFLYDTQYKIAADYKLLLELIHAGQLFEKIDLTVAEMDASGVSHSHRALLRDEKNKIRQSFPIVFFFALLKKRINALRKFWKTSK